MQQASDELAFRVEGPQHAIAVGSEEQLRAALAAADLGWRDRRVVQLTADIQLSSTLVITRPVQLQGNCPSAQGSRCTLRGSAADTALQPLPLVHVTGPAAVVELANLELVGGHGSASLAGGLTASNHSLVDLVAVRLADNVGTAGAGARVDSHARLALTRCEVAGNNAQVRACHRLAGCPADAAARGIWPLLGMACLPVHLHAHVRMLPAADEPTAKALASTPLQQAGGGVYVHSGMLHMDRTTVRDNEAAEGGGVCLAAGSRLTAARSQLGGNRQSGGSDAVGADLLLVDGEESAAYMEPLPAAEQLSGGLHGGKL